MGPETERSPRNGISEAHARVRTSPAMRIGSSLALPLLVAVGCGGTSYRGGVYHEGGIEYRAGSCFLERAMPLVEERDRGASHQVRLSPYYLSYCRLPIARTDYEDIANLPVVFLLSHDGSPTWAVYGTTVGTITRF